MAPDDSRPVQQAKLPSSRIDPFRRDAGQIIASLPDHDVVATAALHDKSIGKGRANERGRAARTRHLVEVGV